jgi:hypothetical protein
MERKGQELDQNMLCSWEEHFWNPCMRHADGLGQMTLAARWQVGKLMSRTALVWRWKKGQLLRCQVAPMPIHDLFL